ncbi:MAG: hypothetical protein HFI37_00460, partial [Lachnospiraceae bacterium]|nr:hypothetical protein [Lachnospiraceae bacterium]
MKHIRMVTAVVFAMMVLLVPSITVSASSCGETVSRDTIAELQAVDYENNETIGSLLAPSRYSLSEKLNKKTEIAKREGKSPADISDEQAIKELNQDNIKVMSFEDAFAKVQAEIGKTIQKVVDSTAGAESKGATFFTNKIRQNKEKLLLGLTYLERLYDFDMGGHNIKDVLLYEPGAYGISVDVLDWLIQIGSAGGDTLKISNNANVFGYRKLFWSVTASPTLEAFLEENRQKWIPGTSMNAWFLQESPAYILEKSSDWDSKNTGIYEKLYNDTITRAYILPLLTVSEDSVYMIANSATITYGIVDCYIDRNLRETNPARYGELREKFLQQLEQAAKQQKSFIDTWYRIAKPEKKEKLSSNRAVLDSLRIDPDTTIQWSDKFGKNAALGVKEFFTPLNLYGTYMFADGVAEGTRIRYYASKALTERGFATYAHELTHILVSEVMLNGYGSRDGMLAEVYTRGMFEPYELNDPPAFNLNLIYDRLAVSDRYHNGLPERFQNEKDLQNYMSGILDIIYTLDYAEADVMFTKSAEEKKKWFHKLEQIEDPEKRDNQGEEGSKHNLDSVRELTLDEAERLNTIDDLIRDSIIVSRYEVNGTETTGTMKRNGYYVVPLFSANYAGVQNDHGVSGDIMIRRQAFELLAEYGYYDGMVPYISNQYKESAKSEQIILSDQYVLKKIFGSTYGTMADFKKAMFQKRIEKINKLEPVTIMWKNRSVTINNFEELRLLMKEAIESDLIKVNVLPSGSNNIRAQATEVERLKQEIFKAYLIQTKDFSESIYGGDSTPIKPPGDTNTGQPEKPGDTNTQQPEKPGNTNTQQPEKPGTETSKKDTTPKLLLCKVSSAKTSHTIRWNSVKSADGYEIYGAKSNGKYKRLRTVGKKSTKWTHKKLKKGKQYKYYVRAYKKVGKKRVILAKSLSVYSTTNGGKYGNPSKITVKKTRVSVKSGKKVQLRVKVTGKKINKTGKKVRYVSSNPSVAKVSTKG